MRSDEDAGSVIDHPDRSVARSPMGGFEIRAGGRPTIRVHPCRGGWSVGDDPGPASSPPAAGGVLERTVEQERGFVLRGADGAELGRTMPLVGAVESGLVFLLLDDGRLFRIVRRGVRETRFELLGWEMPGAYLEAIPTVKGWTLAATAAGGGITDLSVLLILFAAEILDAEEPLQAGKS